MRLSQKLKTQLTNRLKKEAEKKRSQIYGSACYINRLGIFQNGISSPKSSNDGFGLFFGGAGE
jgi:hypothetical protein